MKNLIAALAVLAVLPFPCGADPGTALSELEASAAFPISESDVPAPAGALPVPGDISGEPLFQYLHYNTAFSLRGPDSGYAAAKAYMYSRADNIICDGEAGIMTFYSQVCVSGSSASGNDYVEKGDQDKDGVPGDFVNAEHIWPQTYFNSARPMVADLHQLAASFANPNNRRGSLRFARVSKAVYSTSSGSRLGKEGFEPADAVKGNVARAMLYFVVCYYDRSIRRGMNYNDFWTSRVPLLLEWNRRDPPDAEELRRNGLVEAFQGNRNPFVDDYSLADRVSAAVFAAH